MLVVSNLLLNQKLRFERDHKMSFHGDIKWYHNYNATLNLTEPPLTDEVFPSTAFLRQDLISDYHVKRIVGNDRIERPTQKPKENELSTHLQYLRERAVDSRFVALLTDEDVSVLIGNKVALPISGLVTFI